jgi:hypothetical protein
MSCTTFRIYCANFSAHCKPGYYLGFTLFNKAFLQGKAKGKSKYMSHEVRKRKYMFVLWEFLLFGKSAVLTEALNMLRKQKIV